MATGINGYFPRVITIYVPDDIYAERIGDYVSKAAGDILVDQGIGVLNQKTISLRPISSRLWVLSFDGQTQYSIPKGLEMRHQQAQPTQADKALDPKAFDAGIRGVLPQTGQDSVRSHAGHSKGDRD